MYRQLLAAGGAVHLKTDNKVLYDYSCAVVEENNFRKIYATDDLYHSDAGNEILGIKTTYEKMFLEQGMKICYLTFTFE
jgi:tRNA (guanine-N7-)-methyltransferase